MANSGLCSEPNKLLIQNRTWLQTHATNTFYYFPATGTIFVNVSFFCPNLIPTLPNLFRSRQPILPKLEYGILLQPTVIRIQQPKLELKLEVLLLPWILMVIYLDKLPPSYLYVYPNICFHHAMDLLFSNHTMLKATKKISWSNRSGTNPHHPTRIVFTFCKVYWALSVMYIALLIVYSILCCVYRKDLMGLQGAVIFVIILCLLDALIWGGGFVFYNFNGFYCMSSLLLSLNLLILCG